MAGGLSGRSAESGQDPQNELLEGNFTILDKKAMLKLNLVKSAGNT